MPAKRPATCRIEDSTGARPSGSRLKTLFRRERVMRSATGAGASTTFLMDLLEGRRLFAVTVEQFGAVAGDGRDDRAAIQAAMNNAGAGNTVTVGSGVYNVAGALTVPSGVTLQGNGASQAPGTSTLKFSGIASGKHALIIGADGTATTVTGLNVDGGGVSMNVGSRYRNVRITNNDFTGMPGSSNAAIDGHKSNEGTVIEGNTFHDFKGWGFEFWYMNNGSISQNLFKNITQAMHIMNPRTNVQINGNQGIGLSRMGIELQQRDSKVDYSNGITLKGNAFYNWRKPYWDTFGLSIMPQNADNVRIEDNYLAATFAGGYQGNSSFLEPDSGGVYRFGMPIEAGYRNGGGSIVKNNTIAGHWHIWGATSAMPNLVAQDNKFFLTDKNMNKLNPHRAQFGKAIYNYLYSTEHGQDYYSPLDGVRRSGSWVVSGDVQLTSFPEPPTVFPGADGGIPPGGGGVENPGPVVLLTTPVLSGVALDSSNISLNWTDPNNGEKGYQIQRSLDNKTWDFTKVLNADVRRYVDFGLKAGTRYFYRMKAVSMDGVSDSAWSGVGRWFTKAATTGQGAKPVAATSTATSTFMTSSLVSGKLFSDDLIV